MSSSRIKPNHGGCRLILNSVYSAIWSFPVNKEFVHNWGIQEDKAMTRNKGVITSPSCQMSGLPWKFELSGHKTKVKYSYPLKARKRMRYPMKIHRWGH